MPKRTRHRFRSFGLQESLVVLAVISLTAVQMRDFAIDPGVGWHLLSGEVTLKTESVPRFDPFLASAEPRRWISDQWLGDITLFTLYAAGSWPLVYGALAALYLATYFIVLYPLTVHLTGAPIIAAATSFLAFKVGQLHFILRPVVFGFFCFALTCAFLWRATVRRPGEEAVPPRRRAVLLWLPPVFILWANLHPSFILGLLLVALRAGAILLEYLGIDHLRGIVNRSSSPLRLEAGEPEGGHQISRVPADASPKLKKPAERGVRSSDIIVSGSRQKSPESIYSAILLFVVCVVATFINPNGLELHRSIFALGSDPFFMRYHEEWLPPEPLRGVGLTLTLTTLLAGLAFLTERSPRSWGTFEILVVTVFAVLAYDSIRMVPFFGIVVAAPLARSLANRRVIGEGTRGIIGELRRAWLALSHRELSGARGVVVAILASIILLVDPLVRGHVVLFRGPFGPPANRFPEGAVATLTPLASPERRLIVVAPPHWGGFIAWRGEPFMRPMIDDRNTLLGASFYREFIDALRPAGQWREYLDRHRATHLIWPTTDPLVGSVRATGRFVERYADSTAVVFEASPTGWSAP